MWWFTARGDALGFRGIGWCSSSNRFLYKWLRKLPKGELERSVNKILPNLDLQNFPLLLQTFNFIPPSITTTSASLLLRPLSNSFFFVNLTMDPNANGSSSDDGDGASPGYESFEAMNLKVELRSRLYSYGFKSPTEIQGRVLVPLLEGRNLLVLAKSEPGQVATYCSAIVQLLFKFPRRKFLILGCNTSISTVAASLLSDLAVDLPHLEVCNLYKSIPEFSCLNPNVIVGSPRTVKWEVQNESIYLGDISFVVVDEADSHINTVEVMRYISGKLPDKFQFVVFSETMSGETKKIIEVLKNRVEETNMLKIVVEKGPVTPLEDVTHYTRTLEKYEDKMELLSSIFDNWREDLKCVVFVEFAFCAELILLKLRDKANVKAWGIRANMDQEYRCRVVKDFQEGSINVLILGPYESRGFDVKVPVMINFEMIAELEVYEKKIAYFGTTGGCVINFTMPDELSELERITEMYGVRFEVFPDDFPDVLNIFSSLQSHESHLGREQSHESHPGRDESFDSMNLDVVLWSRLYSYGFKRPTEIQMRALMPLIKGDNLWVQAKSEPGQVATYCSAIVQLFNHHAGACTKFLILVCNTHHTTMVASMLRYLAFKFATLTVMDLSKPRPGDVSEIPAVIVGTPRQVCAQTTKSNISLGKVSLVIVDEADSHINTVQEMHEISGMLPCEFQLAVFSETMSGETMSTIRVLTDRLSRSGEVLEIRVDKESVPFDAMTHFAMKLEEPYEQNMEFLSLAFDNWDEDQRCLVFVEDYRAADHVLLQLREKANVRAWGIRRKMDQEYRDRVVNDYRVGSINVLILTLYEARGFDVKAPRIINFDMCLRLDDYIKQIASFGIREGIAVTMVSVYDDWKALVEAGVYFEGFPRNFADCTTQGLPV